MRKGYKKLTDREYSGLKEMLNQGVTQSVIAKATGRSQATIYYVNQSDSFAGYKEKQREMFAGRKAERTATEVQDDSPAEEIPTLTDEQRGVLALNRIADALEKLVDVWTAVR